MSELIAQRGDTESYVLTIVDAAGARVDLSNVALTFTVKTEAKDKQVLVQKTIGSGITLLSQGDAATKGMATIALLPTDTEKLLAPRTLVFDVEMTTQAGVVTTVISGDLSLVADITR